jgi:serine phosphatase RsbU (regulator of sigma subunit)
MKEGKKFETLFKYASDVVIIINRDGEILVANEKAHTALGASIVGKKIDRILEGVTAHITSLDNSQVVQSFYIHNGTRSKKQLHFKVTLVPLFSGSGVKQLLLIAEDLKKIEPYKEEVERLREQLKTFREERRIESKGKKNSGASSLAAALKKLEEANQELGDMYRKLNSELELAATLQKSLVPRPPEEQGNLQFAFHYEPMGYVGGDYYDVLDLGNGKKGVILADVSGHGVSSAFIAAMLKISFKNYASVSNSPASVLGKLNREYCNVIQTGDYVTAFYTVFDTEKKKIVYSGAGHPRPLYSHGINNIELLSSEGFFIGMFEEADYTDSMIRFDEGDRFLAYTDGIVEAYSEQKGEQFGEKRLLESFNRHKCLPLEQMLRQIIRDVKKFMHKSSFYDDLAMVAVEYKAQDKKR